MFGICSDTAIRDILDGTSNTVLLSERIQGTNGTRKFANAGVGTVGGLNDGFLDPLFTDNDYSQSDLDAVAQLCLTVVDPNNPTLLLSPAPNELPGDRWSDGGKYFVGFGTLLPPNSPSCSQDGWDRSHQVISATSQHAGGVQATMGDGRVVFVNENIDNLVWRALGTKAGNEVNHDLGQ